MAQAIQNRSNDLEESENKIDASAKETREKLVKDLAEYQTLVEKWESQNKYSVSNSGALMTSIQQSSMEQARVAFWGISGAVSIALLLLILRNRN